MVVSQLMSKCDHDFTINFFAADDIIWWLISSVSDLHFRPQELQASWNLAAMESWCCDLKYWVNFVTDLQIILYRLQVKLSWTNIYAWYLWVIKQLWLWLTSFPSDQVWEFKVFLLLEWQPTKTEVPRLPYYLIHTWRNKRWVHTFSKDE